MRKLLLLAGFMLTVGMMKGQVRTNVAELQKAQREVAAQEKALRERIVQLSKEKGWPLAITGKNGRIALLTDIDVLGYPVYVSTTNSLSAATIRTNKLWPGGSTGLNLSGSSANMKSKLGLWDGGRARTSHVELTGRILQKDNPTSVSDHTTHVAGTLMASGVNPDAKGMAFGLQQLIVYDFNNHNSEMLNEASGLLVSNHSYSTIAGWYYNQDQGRWEFYGENGAFEDYKFGYYSNDAQMWDSIAYLSPNYLIVKAAGNNRSENGPQVGETYWGYNASGQMVNKGARPSGMSSNDSYDCIPTYGVAKNILTVGAVNPILSGYARPQDVEMTSFSSWGPTDDGRIKPDVVAAGVDVFSSTSGSDNEYSFFSGTSMAAPAAAGSLLLLQEYYSQLHGGAVMRSATLKGIVIHTADEAGPSPGPDYMFGWGLINMEKAAAVISSNNTDQLIMEKVLNNGDTYTHDVIASGKGPLVVTICWTDPKAEVETVNILNNATKKLVNDLDIRVTSGGNTYMPWRLNPNNRSAAATKGDNTLDNVEKIEIPDAVPGQTYTITVTHKGTLARGSQAYSMIVSGVGGIGYCSSGATNTAGARIDSVSISNVQKKNPDGCTSYTNNTNLTIQAQAGQSLPFHIVLNSCDATNAAKMVKIFIDFNNDGDFNDAGETVATSGVITGNGVFTGNIDIPLSVKVGHSARMRIVVRETNSAANVTPCGSYDKGETQDYRIQFATPSKDVGIVEIVSPYNGSCAIGSQYVSVRIRNLGTAPQSNIPLVATVKQGATTVLSVSFTYPLSIPAYESHVYTFQVPFETVAGATYTVSVRTNLSGDQDASNDEKVETINIANNSSAITGTAEVCGTNLVYLKTNATGFDVPLWYSSATSTTPLAAGNNATTSTITPDKTYYVGLNDARLSVGPANKTVFPQGGYNEFNGNFVRFTNNVPLIIESARLYIGKAGTIKFTIADIVNFDPQTGGYSYYPIASTTINVYPTNSVDRPINYQGNDATDTGAVYMLNLPVPTAGNHAIIVQCENGANIFRNANVSPNPYPVGIPNVFTITGNSATNPSNPNDPNFYQNYYYFFYDMRLRLVNCPGPRTEVVASTATAPVITLDGNTFTSSALVGNQWYRNGVPIPGATSRTYAATQSGTYTVLVTDPFGCALESNAIQLTPTAVIDVDGNEIQLSVTPNPNRGQFNLQFEVKTKRDLHIDLINILGQKVYQRSTPGFIGKFAQEIRVDKVLPGTYFLKIQHGQSIYVKKIVIQ